MHEPSCPCECRAFPGKGLGPGFSLCCRPSALDRTLFERGRRICCMHFYRVSWQWGDFLKYFYRVCWNPLLGMSCFLVPHCTHFTKVSCFSAHFCSRPSQITWFACKFPWPTPHAADPSLCKMSFLSASWHDLICSGSLVLSYQRNVTEHCMIHSKLSQKHWFWDTFWVSLGAILSEFGSLGPSGTILGSQTIFNDLTENER